LKPLSTNLEPLFLNFIYIGFWHAAIVTNEQIAARQMPSIQMGDELFLLCEYGNHGYATSLSLVKK